MIYATIATNIEHLVKHVGLWNEQLLSPEQEQPFDLPAVLVEFRDIEWRPLLHGWREGKVRVVLHVLIDTCVGRYADSLERLALLDELNRSLHGLTLHDGGDVVNALTLVRSSSGESFDEILDHQEEYEALVALRM